MRISDWSSDVCSADLLFRPWPARGEIVALTGHLAENELRGGLTFIERALGIEKAREFYEQESGQALSQSELARRLTADGYPVPQSHISRLNDAEIGSAPGRERGWTYV